MLVLSRKERERIVMNGQNWVEVLRVDGDYVQLRFELVSGALLEYWDLEFPRMRRAAASDRGTHRELTGTPLLWLKVGDSVEICGNIELFVVDCYRGKVRLGFSAPREISIYRKEVYDRLLAGLTPPAGTSTGVPHLSV